MFAATTAGIKCQSDLVLDGIYVSDAPNFENLP